MQIEHAALWTTDLERSRDFYVRFFGAAANDKYVNPVKQFSSYFLTFSSGARLELMHKPSIQARPAGSAVLYGGYAHLAFSTGSQEAVDTLTEQLREAGYAVLDGPRTTGDGYYESVVADPDGNPVEITI